MSIKNIKVVVTGASGQLGQALKTLSNDYDTIDFVFASRSDLDITNKETLQEFVTIHQPDAIINTAAYTAVDKAESNKEAAFLVNERAVGYLAEVCKMSAITLLHISTDYVFNGAATTPYKETDITNPETVYGASKLAGERIIQEIAPEHFFIIRTSWLYSKNGHNFYNTMLRLANEGKDISVVNDQWGTPTLASELATALIEIVLRAKSSDSGIYHYSGNGVCTWYAFAKALLEKYHSSNYTLKAVDSSQYPTVAKRPKYSVLDKSLIKTTFGISPTNWELLV